MGAISILCTSEINLSRFKFIALFFFFFCWIIIYKQWNAQILNISSISLDKCMWVYTSVTHIRFKTQDSIFITPEGTLTFLSKIKGHSLWVFDKRTHFHITSHSFRDTLAKWVARPLWRRNSLLLPTVCTCC